MNDTASRGTPEPPLRPAEVVAAGLWLGLACGLAEVGLIGVAKYGLGRFVHADPQIVWMAPVGYALAFGCIGGVAAAVCRARSGLALRATAFAALLIGGLGALSLSQGLHNAAAAVVAAGVAVQGSAMIAKREAFVRRAVRATLVPLAVVVALAGAWLHGSTALATSRAEDAVAARPEPPAGSPNVLIVVWDTVRAANLSVHGYARDTTPELARLASRGVVFERAMSPAPWTLPSHASMFTGLLPRDFVAGWTQPFEAGPRTLAETLRDGGWRTGGFVANLPYTSRESGLARGFARYDDFPQLTFRAFRVATAFARSDWTWPVRRALTLSGRDGRKLAADVNAEFLAWLDDRPGRPFFAFLNCYDAHTPYLPPAPFDTRFGPLLPGRDPFYVEGRKFTPRELEAQIDAYDGGIAYMDQELGRLLGELDRRGVLANTLVIVTSDHGEEFGEHDVFDHGNTLYDRSLHVPLVMALPGRVPEGRRVGAWVSTRDVAETVRDLAAPPGAPPMPGSSLRRHFAAARAAPQELVATVAASPGHPDWYPVAKGDIRSGMIEPMKLIVYGDGTEEVFDLADDPGERRNILDRVRAESPELLERLRAAAGVR